MYNVIAIEDFGTPVAVLVNRGFLNDAYSAASGKGMPNIRPVAESVDCEATVLPEIESNINAVMDDIITALTKPLTQEEKAPKKDTEQLSRIVFKGSLEEVNRFFYRRGWSDGLPIIPPTEEAVAEMLTGTDLAPDHVVTKIIPRMGKATVEKIAVNAVMAGALPTYMPVLIAAVQAIMEKKARFDTFEVSTGSWAPMLAINGPVRTDINLNCSSGMLSPGNIANTAIGRALGLIVKNIGGARKAVEDMGVIGNPMKYSLVVGEHEEESPWEPLHVNRGCRKEDSALTIFCPNSFMQSIPFETSAQGIADMLVDYGATPISCFILIPSWAKALAREGWTKQRLIEYVVQNTKATFGKPRLPQIKPEDIIIVVAGGPGSFTAFMRSVGGSMMNNEFITKKIELPKNWHNLVAKYKNIVPNYVRY